MATTTLPFDAVEQNMTFIGSGVTISQRMRVVKRVVRQAFLTPAFYEAAQEQKELIVMLSMEQVKDVSSEELLDIAQRLEGLVAKTDQVIAKGRRVNFSLWKDALRQIEENSEKLDSLAESFRMSASEQFQHYLDELTTSHTETGQGDQWREFVATLHD